MAKEEKYIKVKRSSLEKWANKTNEISVDLTEPQEGANLSHQSQKARKVSDDIYKTLVHGGGTGDK